MAMNPATPAGDCPCATLRAPLCFSGWADYDAFFDLIRARGYFSPIEPLAPGYGIGILEHWYRCDRCKRAWRLVEPDDAFAGRWERMPG